MGFERDEFPDVIEPAVAPRNVVTRRKYCLRGCPSTPRLRRYAQDDGAGVGELVTISTCDTSTMK